MSSSRQVIDLLVKEACGRHPGTDTSVFVRQLVQGQRAAPQIIELMARQWLLEQVRAHERAGALLVEVRAERVEQAKRERVVGPPNRGTAAYRAWVRDTDEGRQYHDEWERTSDQIRRQCDARFAASIHASIETYTNEVKMQWTQDLLDTGFALPDGTTVTWGDATVDQHKQRAQMFTANAAANIKGAARHTQAVRDLEASGVETLRTLVMAST